jgi:hypothetical protein
MVVAAARIAATYGSVASSCSPARSADQEVFLERIGLSVGHCPHGVPRGNRTLLANIRLRARTQRRYRRARRTTGVHAAQNQRFPRSARTVERPMRRRSSMSLLRSCAPVRQSER